MPSKKRKYNARFPAGRIKKIMQTDEEVGKVAQAVPIIISGTPRTLELFVESLLGKAMQVTMARNAKTLSPSHVKQCILAESRFDFLRDLVKNIPDVSAAEEKDMMSAEGSPNSTRCSDTAVPPRRIVREDSNSSNSCDVKIQPLTQPIIKRALSAETDIPKIVKTETVTSTTVTDKAIDLSKKTLEEKPVRTANFYQETLLTDEVQHRSVIKVNPSYSSPQPSTSYTTAEIVHKIDTSKPAFIEKPIISPRTPVTPIISLDFSKNLPNPIDIIKPAFIEKPIISPRTPVTPIINIDFSKNLANPEIKLLDRPIAMSVPKEKNPLRQIHRQNSKPKVDVKKVEIKPVQTHPVDIDSLNSGNLQIDEDYDT